MGVGMGWISRIAGALIVAAAVATSVSAAPKKVITQPDWARKPTRDEMEALYPQRAKDEHRSGSARLTCKVKADGALVNCKAHHENPKGYGFDAATLALSQVFLMKPKTINGEAVDGGTVTIPVVFAFPEDRLGNGAVVLTRIGTAASPTPTGPTVPCFDGLGECQIHLVDWAQQPAAKLTRKILGKNAPTTGVTFVVCTVGVDGSLQGCAFNGDELSPKAKSIVESTLSQLRASAQTLDGLATPLKTIAVPFQWDKIAEWPTVRRP
jgi:TonB family protein